jgi:YD repeat-containing protein
MITYMGGRRASMSDLTDLADCEKNLQKSRGNSTTADFLVRCLHSAGGFSMASMRIRGVWVSALGLMVAGGTTTARGQVTAPVFDHYGSTLTSYIASGKSPVQNLRPHWVQRGVDYDGTPRGITPFGMSLAADSLGGGSTAWRRLGDIDLVTGTYSPQDIDLSFPTLGTPVIIGRTYGLAQQDASTGDRYDSNGIMGTNWSQLAQPELVFRDADNNPATRGSTDMIYLVYGADRYIELKRVASNDNTFKAKNGAASVAVIVPDATNGDEITITDTRGTTYTFFGFNNGTASGQLWKTADAAGKGIVVNNATKATAISDYTSNGGRIQDITDASGRVYSFTYAVVGGVSRLTQVNAVMASTTVGTVDYAYYTTNETGKGKIGDLKLVTITLPATSGTLVKSKYYQYYDDVYVNTAGRRGNDRSLKLVVGFEGVRAIGVANLDSATVDAIRDHSEAFFEYPENTWQISSAFFNGECGCVSGGTNGTFTLSYDLSSGYSTYIIGTTYDQGWATRAVIAQPDGKYDTRYFDETGQAMSRVFTNGNPTGTPSKRWLHQLVRNTAGQVTEVRSPEAMGSYTHSTGSLALNGSGTGQITTYTRITSGNLAGLRTSTAVKNGSGGSPITLNSLTVAERQLEVGSSGISLPNVTASTSYPNGGSGLTTSIATNYWSTTATNPEFIAAKDVTITAPVVSTGNNGSGTSTSTVRYHRKDGSVAYVEDGAGIISYSQRDSQGRAIKQIADMDFAVAGSLGDDSPSNWPGLATDGTAIHAVTTMTYDQQGRMLTAERPSANGTLTSAMAYAMQADGQLATFSFPRYQGSNYYGPASISVTNHAGRPVRSATIAIATPSGSLPGTAPSADWSQRVDHTYDSSGAKLLNSKAFHSPTGSTGDTTTFTYDTMGRRLTVTDPTGTIRETAYEERGQPIEQSIGTDRTRLSNGSPSATFNMVVTEKTEYDGNASSGGGNGHATKRSQDADGDWGTTGDQRVTSIQYDWRGRAVVQTNPASPHSVMKYDDLGRVTAVGQYSSSSGLTPSTDPTTTSGSRIGLSETVYDERGQVARSTLHQVEQTTGALVAGAAGSIITNNWHDESGRLVKTAGTQISKTIYDRLGRSVGRAVIAKSTGTSYADAKAIGAGDTVLEESWSGIDPESGRTLIQHSVQRNHDSTATGQLSGSGASLSVNGTATEGRVQMWAVWYDDWDRPIETVQLGTNGGTSFNRSGTGVAARSDTYLRTSTSYDNHGRVQDVTDVAGKVNRTEYDAMGRRTRTIDNYVNGTPGGGTANDEDRVVEYAYTNGLTTSVTRKMPSSSDDQVTTYTYGTTKGGGTMDSQVQTGHLLKEVTYPEQTTGQAAADRRMTTAYNALGQVIKTQDPAGNVITTTYDNAGRSTVREVTTFASGFDTRVRKIETTFSNRGQLTNAKQIGAGTTVLDETTFTYDNWGNPATMVQDPDSAISGGSGRASFTTSWSWGKNTAANAWQNIVMTQVVQPGGLEMNANWGSGIDTDIKRVTQWRDENATPLASYLYMGVGSVVSTTLDEPNVVSKAFGTSSATYGDHLDRFNRTIKQQWKRTGSFPQAPVFVDLEVKTYNRYGQPLAVQDMVLATGQSSGSDPLVRRFDALLTFDGLRRVSRKYEGELSGSAITTPARDQRLARNLAGVAVDDQVDLDGNGNFTDEPPERDNGEMDDLGRVYNKRNELRQRVVYDSTIFSPNTYTLSYDKNGNLTSDDEKYEYVYNPFGQLVQVKLVGTATVAANYTYNALGHRNSEQLDTTDTSASPGSGVADGQVTSHDKVFFIATDMSGRRVATYRGTDTHPKERFAYHMPSGYGVGGSGVASGPMLRTRMASLYDNPEKWATEAGSATHAERFYYAADYRGNVSAIVSSGGNLMEQYRYSATGVPFGIPRGDVNSDGKIEGKSVDPDYNESDYLEKQKIYHVRADWNLDGEITSADTEVVGAHDGIETGRKVMSVAGVGSKVGLSGLELAHERTVLTLWNSLVQQASRYSLAADASLWNKATLVSVEATNILDESQCSETVCSMTSFANAALVTFASPHGTPWTERPDPPRIPPNFVLPNPWDDCGRIGAPPRRPSCRVIDLPTCQRCCLRIYDFEIALAGHSLARDFCECKKWPKNDQWICEHEAFARFTSAVDKSWELLARCQFKCQDVFLRPQWEPQLAWQLRPVHTGVK